MGAWHFPWFDFLVFGFVLYVFRFTLDFLGFTLDFLGSILYFFGSIWWILGICWWFFLDETRVSGYDIRILSEFHSPVNLVYCQFIHFLGLTRRPIHRTIHHSFFHTDISLFPTIYTFLISRLCLISLCAAINSPRVSPCSNSSNSSISW